MNARAVVAVVLLALALPACGDDAVVRSPRAIGSAQGDSRWDPDSKLWRNLVQGTTNSTGLRIGKGDFAVSGPIVDSLRMRRRPEERNLGRKILDLPVICLFVPRPMPKPPSGGGKYFAWGERQGPWISVASGRPAGAGFSPASSETPGGLISVSR